MTDAITGKVAKLLTERDLVINRGSEDGVAVGMRFKILNPKGESIRDPETSQIIGSVEMVKVIVKVVEVQPKLCVARTFKTIRTEASGFAGTLATSYAMRELASSIGSTGTERVETLRSNEKFLDQELDESESYVRTGDPAVQVVRVEKDVEY